MRLNLRNIQRNLSGKILKIIKFIANTINGSYLRDILPKADIEVDGVLAAIAYGSLSANEKEDLIGSCLSNRYRMDIWMRYDHTPHYRLNSLSELVGWARPEISPPR